MSNILIISYALFNYFPRNTGSVQLFTAPQSGTYKLEVWGAEGGIGAQGLTSDSELANYHGAYGGYAYGCVNLANSEKLYICVGGKGCNSSTQGYTSTYIPQGGTGGYNGGGKGGNASSQRGLSYLRGGGGGGGATHVATTSGVLSNLVANTSSVIIVAGGAGGLGSWGHFSLTDTYSDSQGGGLSGNNGGQYTSGTQNSGYTFGKGQDALDEIYDGNNEGEGDGGGGGGWYGGYASYQSVDNNNGFGGGGSGHLGSSLIIGTTGMSTGVRTGNGYTIISWIP